MNDFTFSNPVTAVMGEVALERLAEVEAATRRVSSREFSVGEYYDLVRACATDDYPGVGGAR
ncbi:MAG: hypothetical protein HFJ75_04100 [Eggerthellaceae bacterium]|nr:hypothetical protein [Eggerthellaceae bacterium]